MESVSNNVFLFADLAPAYQEAVQKGIGYDGTSYNLKDGTKITIVAEGYQVDAPKSETVIPGVLEEVADGLVPAPENDLAKTPSVVSNMPATNTPEVTSNAPFGYISRTISSEAGSPTTQEASAPSNAAPENTQELPKDETLTSAPEQSNTQAGDANTAPTTGEANTNA
jgi:hypothetical protein